MNRWGDLKEAIAFYGGGDRPHPISRHPKSSLAQNYQYQRNISVLGE
ncbi:hypothetical protein [Oscillatoria acuminata]|nr:hypothetical protein [Oscillatoria acuminata]